MAVPADYAQGIDVSHWNGRYDPHVRPVDFVISKASEGLSHKDVRFGTDWQPLLPTTIWGAYHYYRNAWPWRVQVDNLLQAVDAAEQRQGRAVDVLGWDYETINNVLDYRTDTETRRALDYLMGAQPRRVLLYSSTGYLATMAHRGSGWVYSPQYEMWVAQWYERGYYQRVATKPAWANWRVWQYGGDYKDKSGWEVPGYGEGRAYGLDLHSVDLNAYNGTLADMRAWLGLPPIEEPIHVPDWPQPEPAEPAICLALECAAPTTGGGLTAWQKLYNDFRILPRR